MVKEGKGMQSAGRMMVGRGKDVDEGIYLRMENLVAELPRVGTDYTYPNDILHSLLHSFS